MAILVAAGAASWAQAALPRVSASPEPLHLKSFELGHAVAETVRLTNVSKKTYRIHFQPEPPESAFSFSDSSCSEALTYRESCQIIVRFKPKHWGETTGRLVYELDDPQVAYAVRLVGTAHQRDGDEGGSDSRLSVAGNG